MDFMRNVLRPYRWLASPVFFNWEAIPQRGPMLFVGNHTLFAVFDTPILIAELYAQRGIIVRSLGDRIHPSIPVWGRLVEDYGVVTATPDNCASLRRAGEAILVFPGGGREVSKRKGEKYQLVWGDRMGFARMAIRHGCPIVPFSAIGVEDAFDILIDADEILASPFGKLVGRLGLRRDLVMPLVKGLGPTPLPRPERLYFRFEPPIDAGCYRDDDDGCRALRDQVKRIIENGIRLLLEHRETDPHRKFIRRLADGLLGEPDGSWQARS
jgi:1-acyl-sn-glycerol-3-phosphate acyltransferase